MKRVAVLADTHMPRGGRRLPDECVERLGAADLILHAGDVVTAGILGELRRLGPPVEAVFGNADEAMLRESLARHRVLEVEAARIGMVHDPGRAAGREERLLRLFPGCDAIVFGHTHAPLVQRREGVWLLNPGSPTERRRSPTRTMIELRVDGRALAPKLVHLGP